MCDQILCVPDQRLSGSAPAVELGQCQCRLDMVG